MCLFPRISWGSNPIVKEHSNVLICFNSVSGELTYVSNKKGRLPKKPFETRLCRVFRIVSLGMGKIMNGEEIIGKKKVLIAFNFFFFRSTHLKKDNQRIKYWFSQTELVNFSSPQDIFCFPYFPIRRCCHWGEVSCRF